MGFLHRVSGVEHLPNVHEVHVLKGTLMDWPITIFPDNDPVYDGTDLGGRSTGVAGVRKYDRKDDSDDEDDKEDRNPKNSEGIRNANDLVVKFSWPEETRVSEVIFINQVKDIREADEFVKGHISTIHSQINL